MLALPEDLVALALRNGYTVSDLEQLSKAALIKELQEKGVLSKEEE